VLIKYTLELEELEVDFIRLGGHILAEALCLIIENGLDFKLTDFYLLIEKTLGSIQLTSRLKMLLQLPELLA